MKLLRGWMGSFGVVLLANAQPVPNAMRRTTSPTSRYGTEWLRQKWDHPDPFRARFDTFERESLSDEQILSQVRSFQRRATLTVDEAFRYGYLAAKARFIRSTSTTYPTPAMNAAEAMARLPQPASAHYSRIRFVLEFTSWPDAKLVLVARRLVAEFPNMPGLQMHLAWGLLIDPDARKLDEAIGIGRELHRKYSTDPDFLALLADAYGMAGIKRSDKNLKKKGIAAYEKLLAMPDLSLNSRKLAELRLKALREKL